MKSNVNIAIALSSWEYACPASQYVTINIDDNIDIHFVYEQYSHILRSHKSDLYLTILDFLGYSLIGKSNTQDSQYDMLDSLLNMTNCFNYDMHEAFIKAKEKFNNKIFGDNNIVIEITYNNISGIAETANIHFPDKHTLKLINDNVQWDGQYETLFKAILNDVVNLKEQITYHKAQNNVFLEDMFSHLQQGNVYDE